MNYYYLLIPLLLSIVIIILFIILKRRNKVLARVILEKHDLEVLRFDFHPTYGIVIFDNSYAIWDNFYFDFKTEKYSFDKNVLLIDISSEVGRELINNSISSFDNLADNYRDL